jgi:hypothetical protein
MLQDRPPQPHEAAAARTLIIGIKRASERTGQEWVPSREVLFSLRAMHQPVYGYSNDYDRKTKQHRLNQKLRHIAILDLIDGRWGRKKGVGQYEWRIKPKDEG